eukprot:527578_1
MLKSEQLSFLYNIVGNIQREVVDVNIDENCIADVYEQYYEQNKIYSFQCTKPFDPDKSFDDQIDHILEVMNGAKTDSLLIFIHGFNNNPDQIAKRTKLIDDYLDPDNIGNIVITSFNWLSKANVLGYIDDLERAGTDSQKLFKFVKKLKQQTTIKRIDFLSHSMGNYLFWNFVNIVIESESHSHLLRDSTIISVAADVNRQKYQNMIKIVMYKKKKTYNIKRWIHFYNVWDVPLIVSGMIRQDNNGRAGRFAINEYIGDNVVSIECNQMTNSHGYIDGVELLQNLQTLFISNIVSEGNQEKKLSSKNDGIYEGVIQILNWWSNHTMYDFMHIGIKLMLQIMILSCIIIGSKRIICAQSLVNILCHLLIRILYLYPTNTADWIVMFFMMAISALELSEYFMLRAPREFFMLRGSLNIIYWRWWCHDDRIVGVIYMFYMLLGLRMQYVYAQTYRLYWKSRLYYLFHFAILINFSLFNWFQWFVLVYHMEDNAIWRGLLGTIIVDHMEDNAIWRGLLGTIIVDHMEDNAI